MSAKPRRILGPALASAILIFLTLVFVAARSQNARVSMQAAAAKPAVEPKENRIQVVLITVRSTGFEPNKVKYPAKPFLLAIDNQSGIEDLNVELQAEDAENHATLRSLAMSTTNLRKREITELKPGEYVLTEPHHPGWSCRFTITP